MPKSEKKEELRYKIVIVRFDKFIYEYWTETEGGCEYRQVDCDPGYDRTVYISIEGDDLLFPMDEVFSLDVSPLFT